MRFVHEFIDRAHAVRDDAELSGLVHDAIRELGFHYYALIHHVDLRRPFPGIVHLQNYPPAWAEHFIHSRAFLEDPVFHASLRTNVGFAWERISDLIRPTRHQREIFEAAGREGIGEGFTMPANIPGERHGSASFATRRGRDLPRRHLPIAELLGAYAFEAARRLRRRTAFAPEPAQLTERQRECLIWAARGKTDAEIATILGVGRPTIKKHFDAARERYDVLRRQQMIVAALFDGQISFLETLH